MRTILSFLKLRVAPTNKISHMIQRIADCIVFIAFCLSVNAQTYQSAESVEYDPSQNRFLVSNGNNMLARASDGTLSFFGSGSTSHGLEVMGNYVFGLSGNQIRGYDLNTEAEVMSLTISGASFLNGLTNDGISTLYATDFSGNSIYKIDVSDLGNPTFEEIVSNTSKTPNGIIYDDDNNRLIFVTWGSNADIRQIDLTDNSMSIIQTTNLGNIDGIDEDNDQNYYVSSWSPDQITKYDSNFENPVIVTTPGLSSPADICYAKAIDTLAIPQGNMVDYVGFEVMTSTNDVELSALKLNAHPNPINDASWIQFELKENAHIDLSIYDMQGRLIVKLLNNPQPFGQHKVLLKYLNLSSGMYSCILNVEEKNGKQYQEVIKLLKN